MQRAYLIIDDQPADVGKRRFNEFSREGMNDIGLLYDRQLKMRHFEEAAAQRYGFQPRKPNYIASKVKKVSAGSRHVSPDARRDLVYTGNLRRTVAVQHIPNAFPTRVTLNMPTPAYAKMTPKDAGAPNLGLELTAVSSDEQPLYESTYKTRVEREYNAWREPVTTRIG